VGEPSEIIDAVVHPQFIVSESISRSEDLLPVEADRSGVADLDLGLRIVCIVVVDIHTFVDESVAIFILVCRIDI